MKLKLILCLVLITNMTFAQQHYEHSWSASGAYVWNPARHTYGIDLTAHYHTTAFHEVRASYTMKRDYVSGRSGDLMDEVGRTIPLSTYLLGIAYAHGLKLDPHFNCFIIGGVQMGTEVANRSRSQLVDGSRIASDLTSFLFGPILITEMELVASNRVSLFTSLTQKFLFFSSTGIARIEFQSGLRYYL